MLLTNKNAKKTQRWVPRRILQAQNYYGGNTLLWVPKKVASTHQGKQEQKLQRDINQPNKLVSKDKSKPVESKIVQVWRRKLQNKPEPTYSTPKQAIETLRRETTQRT